MRLFQLRRFHDSKLMKPCLSQPVNARPPKAGAE